MDLFVPKFIQYQLYLLQLENYELGRYWKLLLKKGLFPRKKYPQRKELVWTAKARALMLMAAALYGLFLVLIGLVAIAEKHSLGTAVDFLVLAALVGLPIYFLWFSLALIIIGPLDYFAKKNLVHKAQAKLVTMAGIKIIGIAGSYGKTTMKEVLRQVLGIKYKVLATPESVNTPVGIARWILNKVTEGTQIIIIEMGEHYQNDIKEICEIAKPDIAVVAGINESHLERMGKMDIVVAAIFEIVSNAKPGAAVVLNGDDRRAMENYKKFIWPDQKLEKYQISNIKYQNFNTGPLCWEAEVDGVGRVEINLLGEYALGDVDAAVKIGKSLAMENQQILTGIKNIKPVGHRLQPIKSAGDILVIDDAYNGNPDGVAEAIKVLGRFADRRKLFITPGLVEMGEASADVHRAIGRELVGVADIVILIRNSVTPWIEEGLKTRDESLITSHIPEIIWFNSAPEAHAALKNILKPGDAIVFQNDWGDQYI